MTGNDERGMLIHLAMSVVKLEQNFEARLAKLEETCAVLHNNNATLTAVLNDALEQVRALRGENDLELEEENVTTDSQR